MLSWIKSKDCLADPKRRYKNHALRVSKRKESKEREREKRPSDDSKGRNEEADEERRGKKRDELGLEDPDIYNQNPGPRDGYLGSLP